MRKHALLTLFFTLSWLALQGCAHTSSAKIVLSMQDLDCASCGGKALRAVKQNPHVTKASFNYANAELAVTYDPKKTSETELQSQASTAGFEIVIGEGKGTYLPPERYDEGLDVAWVTKEGEAVDMNQHLADGKITIVDFYAPWCGPCRVLDKHLNTVLKEQSDVAVRKLNMVTWETPLAKKYSGRMTSLPHVFIFDADGNEIASISGMEPEQIQAAIDKARK